jgi:hypothetical protein
MVGISSANRQTIPSPGVIAGLGRPWCELAVTAQAALGTPMPGSALAGCQGWWSRWTGVQRVSSRTIWVARTQCRARSP